MFKPLLVVALVGLIILCAVMSCSEKSTEAQVCATPTFTPAGGSFAIMTSVSISTTTEGASIRYTIDGSNPTANSLVYTSPIILLATTTIKALAYAPGWSASEVATATYTLQ